MTDILQLNKPNRVDTRLVAKVGLLFTNADGDFTGWQDLGRIDYFRRIGEYRAIYRFRPPEQAVPIQTEASFTNYPDVLDFFVELAKERGADGPLKIRASHKETQPTEAELDAIRYDECAAN